MGRPEVTGRKIRLIQGTGEDDRDAFSVREFCSRHGISVQVFYKRRSEMPDTFRVGSRVLISKEAAARWRAAGERAVGVPDRPAPRC
jgi:hypothetical protein